jgi:hypothetical protein
VAALLSTASLPAQEAERVSKFGEYRWGISSFGYSFYRPGNNNFGNLPHLLHEENDRFQKIIQQE